MLSPGEEHRRFPVTTRSWKEARKIPPPGNFRGSTALLTARRQTSVPQNWETIHSYCFKLLGSWSSVTEALGTRLTPFSQVTLIPSSSLNTQSLFLTRVSVVNFLFAQDVLLPFFLFHDTSCLSFSSQLKCHPPLLLNTQPRRAT